MTWRDRIDPELRGSFRGVEFHVEQSGTNGGRRWLVHEYPRRDTPYAEDMGRRKREWRLSFFVSGEDYDLQRDLLIDALDAPGAATLVHPYVGSVSAVALDPNWTESSREGGSCTFEVTFVESGLKLLPSVTIDTQREVGLAADTCEAKTEEDFLDRWSIEGLTGWSLTAIERDLTSVLGDLEQFVGGIADGIASAIRFPVNIVGIVLGGFNRLRNAVMRPINALDLYSGRSVLSSDSVSGLLRLPPGPPVRAVRMLRQAGLAGDAVARPDGDTPENAKRAANILAAQQLCARLAAITAARVVAETDWLSRQDADEAGKDALALIDHQLQTSPAINDDVYNALAALRAALVTDLRERATALPNLASFTPQTTLPALVVAQRLYGDATRADEICVRNNVRHPGAVRGGMTLEVLSE
ncbi:DNA circularization protein [Pseudomonas putida]|uniref:DNA circularization protein n=1 Tax=Pseudomonas putida TaxID=303 RepID=UPI002DB81894|nr:DNA circularization N-terminal domain-containing protein [Pseudomonas putida]WRW04674.1 DNA circularization N-terminal domain-containing protein [Pseudomonas putida]